MIIGSFNVETINSALPVFSDTYNLNPNKEIIIKKQ